MNLLSVENISKSYGERVLFKEVSFGLEEGERVALIAKNGAGKSTLLNILCGKDTPDRGKVVLRKDLRIGMLDQEPEFDETKTVIESALLGESEVSKMVREYEIVLEKTRHDESVSAQKRLHELNELITALNGWDHENDVRTLLSKLGFTDLAQKAGTLSGGQKKRLALAQLLISEPEFLILDEPTNHLDFDMIEWLEGYLTSRGHTLLLVTHDRYFLDRVCERIIEIDNEQLYNYDGDFSFFIERKAEREEQEASSLEKARNLYRRELVWVRKMPRARGTKQKARKDAFKTVAEKARGKLPEEELKLEVKMSRMGGKIIEMIRVNKSFGEKKILQQFDYTFKRGEKIGVIGKNGSGKSTFLNMILGAEPLDSGKIQPGETIVFGYYSQSGMVLKEDKRVIEVVKDIAEYFPLADGAKLSASQMLQRFLFTPHSHFSFVSSLSGGEKRRLYLLTILMKNPNFLILDEPTNDLDILTLGILEEFIADFPGCVLIVSHDRYFMDKLVDHLFVFEGDGVVKDFPGNYSQWREFNNSRIPVVAARQDSKIEKETDVEKEVAAKAGNTDLSSRKKPSFKEKFEFEKLEKEIPLLEKEKKSITEKLSVISDHEELIKLSERFAVIEKELEEKSFRWMELSELMP
ncbi:MAG: ABC-F family ATP-binding cassette domain-containing protein [Bacteroidetes bacterium]|nr:ABC-F family ATP-binding cassette domain-containing protein [Bacteroidota bacterium]